MTSRERLIAAVKHQPVDRMAVDIGATRGTSITVPPYVKLLKHLGIEEIPTLIDSKMFLPRVSMKLIDYYGGDTVGLFRQKVSMGLRAGNEKKAVLNGCEVYVPGDYNVEEKPDGELIFKDIHGKPVATKLPTSYFFDLYDDPAFSGPDFEEAIKKLSPEAFSLDAREREYLLGNAKKFHETTDKAVVGNLWFNVLERGNALRGFENMLADVALKEDYMFELLDKIVAGYLDSLDWFMREAAQYADVICLSDDLGTQSSLIISPGMYREVLKPYHKKLVDKIKTADPDMLVFMHSCGAVSELIPDYIDIGIDVLNPVQITAAGMDAKTIKKKFGGNISFWGGALDAQLILSRGTPEEVRENTLMNTAIFKENSGYVCAPSHNIQPNISLGNALAYLETVKEITEQ